MTCKLVFTEEEGDQTGVCPHTWAAELRPLMKILDLTLNQIVWCTCHIWSTHYQAYNMTTKGILSLESSFSWTWTRTFSYCLEEILGLGGEGQRIKSPLFETQIFSLSHMAKLVRQGLEKCAWRVENWLYPWLKGWWPVVQSPTSVHFLAVSLRDWHWGQYCWMSSWITWTVGQRTPSAS